MPPEIYQNGKKLKEGKKDLPLKIFFSMYGIKTVNSNLKVSLQFCISSKAAIDGYFILVT